MASVKQPNTVKEKLKYKSFFFDQIYICFDQVFEIFCIFIFIIVNLEKKNG